MRSPLTQFILTILVGTGVLVWYGVWRAEFLEKGDEVAHLQGQIAEVSATMDHISSARAAVAEIAGDEAMVKGYFVSENSIASFINGLEARGSAQKAVVTVQSVSTGSSPAHPTLAFSISVKGTFNAVLHTIGSIEYAPYAISTSSFSMRRDDKDAWSADLNLVVGTIPAEVTTAIP